MSWLISWLEMLSISRPELITETHGGSSTALRRHSHHPSLSNDGLTQKHEVN